MLVCLAVCYQRKLQNMFNYFLVSLALSDMLSAILVMPLSIIKMAVGTYASLPYSTLFSPQPATHLDFGEGGNSTPSLSIPSLLPSVLPFPLEVGPFPSSPYKEAFSVRPLPSPLQVDSSPSA